VSVLAALAELVLPVGCAGCGAERVPLTGGACSGCVAELEALVPAPCAPDPVPPGLPACTAVGPYGGALREVLLGYKERGRYRLARPLGALLAGAVAAAAGGEPVPLVLVPMPSTARASRARHGDHLGRLAAHAVRRLRAAGWHAELVQPLRALPRPDSARLDAAGRAAAARASLRCRAGRVGRLHRAVDEGAQLVLVDDIVTTGATLAAAGGLLGTSGLPVRAAAVLAATQRRRLGIRPATVSPPVGAQWANRREWVVRTWGDSGASTR
jgi:predicted amidophosphoribosyltransferase